jgi:tetratricopeptide (TPR) repeat protein
MDGMQFGRWISERRRARGWTSQRALLDAVVRDAVSCEAGISEDFIARLEAGRLVYPFRGRVRHRVLLLSRLLCASPRDLHRYLRAAAIARLSPREEEVIASVRAYLMARVAVPPQLLPRRPTRLVARDVALAALIQALASPDAGLCCVTGMPGIGKSALASEAIHRLASDERMRSRHFPDGVVAFTCTGRYGPAGLASLLDDISAVFASRASIRRRTPHTKIDSIALAHVAGAPSGDAEVELAPAQALDALRQVMANKRALILLDDLNPHLPLQRVLDALLAPRHPSHTAGTLSRSECTGNVVLTTSRHIPIPAGSGYRLALGPLPPHAASRLFEVLLGHSVEAHEAHWADAICAALGYLPLAIELAAAAVGIRRIPLPLLAAQLQEHPLDRALDGDGELHSRIAAALAAVDASARQRFALLSALGSDTFSLDAAAALGVTRGAAGSLSALERLAEANPADEPTGPALWEQETLGQVGVGCTGRAATVDVARAAADLGQLVQHSLLEAISGDVQTTVVGECAGTTAAGEPTASAERTRYRFHPVLRMYAAEQASTLGAEAGERAARHVQEYAVEYAERHRGEHLLLERERDLLIAALLTAADAGQHGQARDLALSLRIVMGRRGVDPAGERALLVGARAAHSLGDRHAMIRLLYRLGTLHFYRGAYQSARRIWEDAFNYAEGLGDLPYTRLPIRGLGFLAEASGEHEEALHHAAAYKQACLDDGDAFSVAGGLISHAYQLRIMGRAEESLEDASACLEIMLPTDHGEATPYQHIVAVEARMELARLSGDYQRALTEECVSLNRRYRDHFMSVECLVDQAEFAFGLGERSEARAQACRAMDLATAIGASGQHARARALLARC